MFLVPYCKGASEFSLLRAYELSLEFRWQLSRASAFPIAVSLSLTAFLARSYADYAEQCLVKIEYLERLYVVIVASEYLRKWLDLQVFSRFVHDFCVLMPRVDVPYLSNLCVPGSRCCWQFVVSSAPVPNRL